MQRILYVLGPEGCGKTDLVMQLEHFYHGELRLAPSRSAPTMGQEVSEIQCPDAARRDRVFRVEIRELGGSIANTWASFIRSRTAKDAEPKASRYALLYVVDATAPHQLPLSAMMLQYLCIGSSAVCSGWPVMVAIQKSAPLHAMMREEMVDMVFCPELQEAIASVAVVDSWNGVGIGDVAQWLQCSMSAGR